MNKQMKHVIIQKALNDYVVCIYLLIILLIFLLNSDYVLETLDITHDNQSSLYYSDYILLYWQSFLLQV